MRIVLDASALLAVLLNQEEKESIVEKTLGASLISPYSLHWEIGNALSSLLKKKVIGEREALDVLDAYARIPIQLEDLDLKLVIPFVKRHQIYAYDAYMLLCAKKFRVPLLTLDKAMVSIAKKEKITVLEV